jgi:hypothetical protein
VQTAGKTDSEIRITPCKWDKLYVSEPEVSYTAIMQIKLNPDESDTMSSHISNAVAMR